MTETKAKINPLPNGPYIVNGVTEMKGTDGKVYEAKDGMALCRCGRSSNMPFCDGTHNRVGIRDDVNVEASGKDKILTYEGANITVAYNPRICSHAAVCVKSVPKVFDPKRKPWIEPDNDDAKRVAAAVRGCPSGALRVVEDGEATHLTGPAVPIIVERNGPLRMSGVAVETDKTPGEGASEDKMVLCRCGLSGNKPYCDGSHYNLGWKEPT